MTVRVSVEPALLEWAIERSGLEREAVANSFPKLAEWISGDSKPTLKQLEKLAKATHAPLGYLFLPAPPVEMIPIPDMRTMGNAAISRPSPDLLDTVYACQQRQEWYQEFARIAGEGERTFVGSVRLGADIVETAAKIRTTLGFDLDERRECSTWAEALRRFSSSKPTSSACS